MVQPVPQCHSRTHQVMVKRISIVSVCLSVCLYIPADLPVCRYIELSIYGSVDVSNYDSIELLIYRVPSIQRDIELTRHIGPPIDISINHLWTATLCMYRSVNYRSIDVSVNWYIDVSIYLLICLFICFSLLLFSYSFICYEFIYSL
jgi:hypothetical protein